MSFNKLVAAPLLAIAAISAPALAAVDGLVAGATVYGPEGNEVGTVVSIEDGIVTLNTGNNVAALAETSFGPGVNGPVMGLTKAQFDATLEQAAAKAAAEADARLTAALVEGATVSSYDGILLGTIGTIDAEAGTVVLQRETGGVMLPRDNFSTNESGLIVLFTAAQLEAALSGSAGS